MQAESPVLLRLSSRRQLCSSASRMEELVIS